MATLLNPILDGVFVTSAIIRPDSQVTYMFPVGNLVPVGTVLVTPDL